MKTFGGNKEFADVKNDCLTKGFALNDKLYREAGHDHVRIDFSFHDSKAPTVFKDKNVTGHVLWSAFNGRFFGTLDKTKMNFDSDDSYLDGSEWYSQLLELFYKPKESA